MPIQAAQAVQSLTLSVANKVATIAPSGADRTWATQNKTTLDDTFAKLKTDFYATHQADDHPRQRQKLALAATQRLRDTFPDQDFDVQLDAASKAVAVKSAS